MLKTLLAGLTALSLAITAPTQVSAQSLSDEELGRLIFGLVALGAIGHIVSEKKRETHHAAPRAHPPRPAPEPGFVRPRHPTHGALGTRSARKSVPRACLFRYETRFGNVAMFGRRCLQRAGVNLHRLPNQCRVRAVTEHGARAGYDPHCLRSRGWRGHH